MKDLNKLYKECLEELDSIGIEYGKIDSITVNTRAKTRFGQCRIVKNAKEWENRRYSINISAILLNDTVSDESVKNTIIHEILHTCRNSFTHKEQWKRNTYKVKKYLGYDIKRSSSDEEKGIGRLVQDEDYRYIYECPSCGQVVKRMRASNFLDRYKCGRCKCDFEQIKP